MGVKPCFLFSLGRRCEQAGDKRDLACDVSFVHPLHLPFPHHVHYLIALEHPESIPLRGPTDCLLEGVTCWFIQTAHESPLYQAISWPPQWNALLLGLNRLYYPGWRWLDRLMEGLQVTPPNLAPRLKQLFAIVSIDPLASVYQLHDLIEETFRLVETHLGEVDTHAARQRFRG